VEPSRGKYEHPRGGRDSDHSGISLARAIWIARTGRRRKQS